MLDILVFEELKKDQEEHETQIPLQLPTDDYPEEEVSPPKPVPSDRGVVIIDL